MTSFAECFVGDCFGDPCATDDDATDTRPGFDRQPSDADVIGACDLVTSPGGSVHKKPKINTIGGSANVKEVLAGAEEAPASYFAETVPHRPSMDEGPERRPSMEEIIGACDLRSHGPSPGVRPGAAFGCWYTPGLCVTCSGDAADTSLPSQFSSRCTGGGVRKQPLVNV